jgi:uncharacterized protein
MTCALAEIDDSFIEMLNNIENVDVESLDEEKKELVDNMLKGNYIVKKDVDELKLIRFRHFSGKFNRESLGLTIAPTLSCNFKCPYCYENPKQGMMSEETQNAIIDLVTEAAKRRKSVSVTWYGGEPLIAKDIIWDMSEKIIKICEENGADYSSYIVTNGYLINDEVIENFKKARITGAQITLDGPPEVHNKRRILKGGIGTFDIILENVKKMKQNGFNVNIRVNVDKENIDRIEELLDILEQNDLKDLTVGLGHVTAYTEACMSISETCLNTEEYAKKDVEYQKLLYNRGFAVEFYPNYPGIKANYCCADSVNSFVIDPEGYMYKCWNDVGTIKNAVGNVKTIKEAQSDSMYMKNVNYILWSPFDFEECVECALLPICMGGCPYNGARNEFKPDCEKWKYNLEDVIKFTYLRKDSIKECCEKEECTCA